MTIVGTIGVCVGALAFYPGGHFLAGTLFITAFVFSDTLDGVMARQAGRSGPWGAFLDSTLDRLSESAIFVGIISFYAASSRPHEALLAGVAMTFSLRASTGEIASAGLSPSIFLPTIRA